MCVRIYYIPQNKRKPFVVTIAKKKKRDLISMLLQKKKYGESWGLNHHTKIKAAVNLCYKFETPKINQSTFTPLDYFYDRVEWK